MTDATHAAKNTCEVYEADLSAVLDGELETVDLLHTLDHLVSCPACAEFYRRSRDLDLAVATSRQVDEGIEPSDAVWQRIAESAPWSENDESAVAGERVDEPVEAIERIARVTPLRRRRRARVMDWAPRLAAAFVVSFGLWIVYAAMRDAGSAEFFHQTATAEASVDVLSENDLSESLIKAPDLSTLAAEMDEDRFVRLATEVLEADPRFHYEMLRVMKSATRADSREAATDARRVEEDRERPESSTETRREAGERAWK